MSHTTLRSGYTELVERLNRFPQGAPPSDTLYQILQILFSEREAQLVALLPIKHFIARHGYARSVDVSEGMDLLQQAHEKNLVQFGENVREGVNFICNCCGCCCEAMIAARKFGILNPVHTSNFLPVINEKDCNGCGKCVSACPVEAMTLVSTNDPHHPKMKRAKVDEEACLGCGVCLRTCSHAGLSLRSRPQRVITPVNSVHRVVMMAIERGDLQNLIFDNRVLWNHRHWRLCWESSCACPPSSKSWRANR